MKLLIRSRLMNITIERQKIHLKTNDDEFGPGKRQSLKKSRTFERSRCLPKAVPRGACASRTFTGGIALPRLDAINPSGDHRWIRRAMTVVDAALKIRAGSRSLTTT